MWQDGGGAEKCQKSVTYFLNGPYDENLITKTRKCVNIKLNNLCPMHTLENFQGNEVNWPLYHNLKRERNVWKLQKSQIRYIFQNK